MSIDQVRPIWRARAESKENEIWEKYREQKAGRSGGREGLGIWSKFQTRVSDAKERLAAQLLKSAGLPVDEKTIRKLMKG